MTHRIDTRSLTQFIAVADARGFRQAAEALHMSQPPLSRAIRELESRVGVRLFERDTHSVGLTDAGRRLLPQARQIVAMLDQAQRSLQTEADPRWLRLGLTTAVDPEGFAPVLAALKAARPGLHVHSFSGTSPQLVRLLRRHRLDAALIALPTLAEGLDVTPLSTQPMLLALPSSHRLAKKRSLHLHDLDGEPLFLFARAQQPAFYDHCQQVFARHGYAPLTLPEPTDHPLLLAQIAAGRGIALLPRSFSVLRRPGVSYRPLAEGEELAVGLGLVVSADRLALRDLLIQCANPGSR